MFENLPSACLRITGGRSRAATTNTPRAGSSTFRWFDQKSTITSKSWRLLQAARTIDACPSAYIRSQEPSSVS